MVKGSWFTIFTDHNPFTYALRRFTDPWMARQRRQLAYIAKHTSEVRHIAGTSNVVAGTLSRPPASLLPTSAATSGPSRAELKPASVKVPPGLLAAAIASWVFTVAASPPTDVPVDYTAMAVEQKSCRETSLLVANWPIPPWP
jgi:hypothetical protein